MARKSKPSDVINGSVSVTVDNETYVGSYTVKDRWMTIGTELGSSEGAVHEAPPGHLDVEGIARLLMHEIIGKAKRQGPVVGEPRGGAISQAKIAAPSEGAQMNPIDGKRGKLYHAITCGNNHCGAPLLLAELTPQSSCEEQSAVREGLRKSAVRCHICTQVTLVRDRNFFTREMR